MSSKLQSDRYQRLKEARQQLTGPNGSFEIVRTEVLGRSNLVFKNAPENVRTVWEETRRFGDKTYLVYNDETMTYAEAHRQVDNIAAWLSDQGVGKGDRVGIAMRNYPEWLLTYWACLASGITVVGFNAWWTADEMAYALADSQPAFLVVDDERLERACHALPAHPKTRIVAVRTSREVPGGVLWQELVNHVGPPPKVAINPDHDACIFYTSGTTGNPKGAQLTHRGCVSTLFNQLFSGACTALASGVNSAAPADPVVLITTPLFHVTANNCGVYPVTHAGGKVVLMYKWDPGEALRLIEREGVTRLSGVPLMSRELIVHPDFAKTDTSSLLALSGGGAQVPPDLVLQIAEQGKTAKPSTGYGMTETCGVITSVTGEFFVGKPESAGPFLPNYEVKCVDDNGCEVPLGEVGELWVRGSSVIKGYINKPEATAEAIVDGWLKTGDVAKVDGDGFIYIVDRKKDMVLRGGENVYCAEVEAVIYRHSAVAECSVFGVPDDRLGEEVAAAIYAHPGSKFSADELREFCKQQMAKHKVPRYVWFLETPLPQNANGKFLKRELRTQLIDIISSAKETSN